MKIRVGQGIDFHRLEAGLKLWLGGVNIPHSKGCVAHSDGDVLIHAICDSLLGAAGLKDIGHYFPDTSSEFKGIDSTILLEKTMLMVTQKGYSVVNIDCTLCLEKPKISPYIDKMKDKLSVLLQIGDDDISIKATTTEKMGFVGREEGVTAYAVVLLTAK